MEVCTEERRARPQAWVLLSSPGRAVHPNHGRANDSKDIASLCILLPKAQVVCEEEGPDGVHKMPRRGGGIRHENYLTLGGGILLSLDKQYSSTLYWGFGPFSFLALNTTAIILTITTIAIKTHLFG